LSWSW